MSDEDRDGDLRDLHALVGDRRVQRKRMELRTPAAPMA
jgi:hypothetical protein